jgi:hypothetical protein
MDVSNVHLFTALKILGQLRVNDKLVTRGRQITIDPPTWWSWVFRWKNSEKRDHNVDTVTHILVDVFERVDHLQRHQRLGKKTMRLIARYYAELCQATAGLRKLQDTYNRRPATYSELEVLLEQLDEKLVALRAWLEARDCVPVPVPVPVPVAVPASMPVAVAASMPVPVPVPMAVSMAVPPEVPVFRAMSDSESYSDEFETDEESDATH